MKILTRYRSREGDRAVTLIVTDDGDRPFSLSDRLADDRLPGAHLVLASYATREEAQEAAEQHADACAGRGTLDVWHRHAEVGL
jgi:hypothetical protein